jgi:hypothetical protein
MTLFQAGEVELCFSKSGAFKHSQSNNTTKCYLSKESENAKSMKIRKTNKRNSVIATVYLLSSEKTAVCTEKHR